MHALCFNLIFAEERHDPLRGTGGEDRGSGKETAEIHRVESVHILLREDRFDHLHRVDVGRERKLDQNP